MSDQRLFQKYRPGDEIDMVVHIQHAPMHLKEVTARFFSNSAKVAPDDAPGVYRLNRVTVKTYGGREHHYSADELDKMGFEIEEEPDNRPVVLQIEMGFRTDY